MKIAVVRARIPQELKKDFEEVAAAHDMSLSYVMPADGSVCRTGKKIALRHEQTLEAPEDIEVGRVVDGAEVMDWLSSWGTEDEQEPPQ